MRHQIFRHLLALLALAGSAWPAAAQTILTEWASIPPPPAPELRAVTIEPRTTALLMLDFQTQNCGRRPRCLASVPAARRLLAEARARGVAVIHSVTASASASDIVADLAATAGERIVPAGPNKFIGTELAALLREKNIGTVIVLGTAAHGAVLNTAAHAALLGINVVLPVDGISADNAYQEQYSIHHMANAPGVRTQTTLTSVERIGF